ncbi:MAG: glycosyltransferase family 4 protein [Chlorobium sp.]|nr:glycosyltransferase family 4 protein [Chlorobium sp.]
MKIVNIMQCTALGGMEQASLRLMIGLQEQGHSCEVISLNPVAGLGPLLEKQGIPVTGLPYLGKGGWRSFPLIWRALRTVRADALIMTGHHLLAMLALGNLCRGRRLLAIHFHHTGVKPSWQWRLIYRIACNSFQAITFPSDFIRNEAEMLFPPLKSVAHTVYNPLPSLPCSSVESRLLARHSLGLPLDIPIIGNAGWLIPRKRFDLFLQVAAKVLQSVPNALFLIAGDGEERTRLEALAAQLKISERIKWLGWQRDMTPFYHSIDVLLFNSDWDAMATTPLEAMGHGVPLVASNIHGGLKEIITGNEYGYLISTHDVDALAARVVFYLRNPLDAKKIAMAGRKRVAEVSSPPKLTSRVEELLLGVEENPPGGRSEVI